MVRQKNFSATPCTHEISSSAHHVFAVKLLLSKIMNVKLRSWLCKSRPSARNMPSLVNIFCLYILVYHVAVSIVFHFPFLFCLFFFSLFLPCTFGLFSRVYIYIPLIFSFSLLTTWFFKSCLYIFLSLSTPFFSLTSCDLLLVSFLRLNLVFSAFFSYAFSFYYPTLQIDVRT